MASFQMLPFTFLLWNIFSDIQAGCNCLSSSKPTIAELGKAIMITCKNNEPIDSMGLRFCPLKGNHCISIGSIQEQNGNLTANETTLKIHSNMVFLSINQINISHEGTYRLNYITKKSMDNLIISLEVFAPYTQPQVRKQENTLICTTSGGYPEEKLYWVSKTGTNLTLTHKSTSQSVKNENGSFSLSNTLQLESASSEMVSCCINNTRIPSRQPASVCRTLENVSISKHGAEKTKLNMTETIVIVIAIISLACILLTVIWWRTGRKNYLLQEWQKFYYKQTSVSE